MAHCRKSARRSTTSKNKPEVAEEKKLRQRRVYVATRPKEVRTELGAAGAELKDILGKIKKAA